MANHHQRRKSFFALTPLRSLTTISDSSPDEEDKPKVLQKRRTVSSASDGHQPLSDRPLTFESDSPSPSPRPIITTRSNARPTSIFGSLKSIRSSDENIEEPQSATSSVAPSVNWDQLLEQNARSRNVIHHGEVQTSTSMFRKKKEYMVLTETHIFRLKSYSKAAELFKFNTPSRLSARHQHTSSYGSVHEMQSVLTDNSSDRDSKIPLRQVVAVYRLDDGRPYFAIEVAYLDDETNQPGSITLQFSDPDERGVWLRAIRHQANEACLSDDNPLSESNSIHAARFVEYDRDYDPTNYAIYKIVQRASGKHSSRSSTDDLTKIANTVCLLAIGVHKIHLIPLPLSKRASSPALAAHNSRTSFGILAVTEVRVGEEDDIFSLTVRIPFEPPRVFHLASLASHDIALRLRIVEDFLRPEWESRPLTYSLPATLRRRAAECTQQKLYSESLDRTLVAYCAAYGINPEIIRYQIIETPDDSPQLQLFPPSGSGRSDYTRLELLAILRSLRYHESFTGLSFANIPLDALNGCRDSYGNEHVCKKTKKGEAVRLRAHELEQASLLVQEIRALAITNKKLRRMDFTSCINRQPEQSGEGKPRDMGCGILEALAHLCTQQSTNVDWIALNNIQLGETDLDYLIGAAADRMCHFRAIELGGCGLTDRGISLIMDALKAQENTFECINIANNYVHLEPSKLNSHICSFAYIRKLDLSNLSRAPGQEPLLYQETLSSWRLEELSMSNTPINSATLHSICCYLESRQSETLQELRLNRTGLTGHNVARVLMSSYNSINEPRKFHLDISRNELGKGHAAFCEAISNNTAPVHLTMKLIEYEDEQLRDLFIAVTANHTIQYLDLSKASLPDHASLEACEALEKLFKYNNMLQYLDISGEDTRLESYGLGDGVHDALRGLKLNNTLKVLWIQNQKLGLQGANAIADVIRVNSTLQELHCESKYISLAGFTDIVEAVSQNHSILFIPTMDEGQQEHIRQAREEAKNIRNEQDMPTSFNRRPVSTISTGLHMANKFTPRNKASKHSRFLSKDKSSKQSQSHFTIQDTNAALRLIEQGWDVQVGHLQRHLHRNYCIHNGIPFTPETIEEEDMIEETLDPKSDVTQLLREVHIDQTPRVEIPDPITSTPDANKISPLDSPVSRLKFSDSPTDRSKYSLLMELERSFGSAFPPSLTELKGFTHEQ